MVQKTNSWKKYQDLPNPMQGEAIKYLSQSGISTDDKEKFMFQVKEEQIWAAIYHKTLADLTEVN